MQNITDLSFALKAVRRQAADCSSTALRSGQCTRQDALLYAEVDRQLSALIRKLDPAACPTCTPST